MTKTILLFALGTTLVAPVDTGAQTNFTKVTTGDIANDQGGFAVGAWADFENRGFLDLLVCNFGGTNLFYRNEGNGTFTKITGRDPVQGTALCVCPGIADFDNDGYPDLLITTASDGVTPSQNLLYHNNGDGTFTAVSGSGVTNIAGNFNACAVADYDNDGSVDLYVPGFGTTGLLFHNNNNGDGTFSQVPDGPLVTSVVYNDSVSFADYDGDGRMDVLVNNPNQANPSLNFLFHNDGGGTFTQILTNVVATDTWPDQPWGAAWGDYDNDGLPDLFVTGMQSGNRLYHNNGNGIFTNVITGPMLSAPSGGGCRACAWGDYDNDGYLDLIVSGYNSNNRLFHNNGDGTFTEILSGDPVEDPGSTDIESESCGWADYDNDGFLDLFVARLTFSGTPISNLLYHNNGNSNAWLEVKLVGTLSNRSAIGAKVRARATIGGKTFWQLREINSGGGRWIQPLVAHFGLGDATNVDTLRIEWPSQTIQEFHNISPRQILTITEPPRLLAETTNGVPQFWIKGGRNLQYDILASSELVSTNPSTWARIATVTITNLNGTAQFVDANASGADSRFYRAVSH